MTLTPKRRSAQKKPTEKAVTKPYEPTPEERAAVDAMLARKKDKRPQFIMGAGVILIELQGLTKACRRIFVTARLAVQVCQFFMSPGVFRGSA